MLNSSAQKDNQRDREILLDEIADVLTEKDFLYLKSTQVIELLSNMAGSRIGNDQLFLDS